MSRDSELDKKLVAKYGLVYQQLYAYFMAGSPDLRAIIEREIGRYAAWADMEIQAASISAVEQSLRETKKETEIHLKAEQVIPLLSYLEKDRLTTLGKDVAEKVDTGLKVGIAIEVFRRMMGLGLVWTRRAARTAIAYAGRDTKLLAYRANARFIDGWIWVSAMLPTTCMACIAMHGTFHRLDERLNDHASGYCQPKPWRKGLPGIELGTDLFSLLSDEEQKKRMGPGKWEAWKSGRFDFRDLITTYQDDTWGELIREASLKGLLGDEAKEWYGGK